MKTLLEYIIDVLTSTRIYEMAEQQKDCERRVKSYLDGIIENALLLTYFGITKRHTTNTNHLKNELVAAVWNAGHFTLKQNNGAERRRRLVARCIKEREADTYQYIREIMKYKFSEEEETGFDVMRYNDSVEETVVAVQNQMKDFAELIVNGNIYSIQEYVRRNY